MTREPSGLSPCLRLLHHPRLKRQFEGSVKLLVPQTGWAFESAGELSTRSVSWMPRRAEREARSFGNQWSQSLRSGNTQTVPNLATCMCLLGHSVMSDSLTPQAPLSKGFSKQVYCSGLPFPPLREFSHPRDQTQVSCTGRSILYH